MLAGSSIRVMIRGMSLGEGLFMASVKVVPAVGLLDGDGDGFSVVEGVAGVGGEGS